MNKYKCIDCKSFICSAGYFYAYTAYELGDISCGRGKWEIENESTFGGAEELRKKMSQHQLCKDFERVEE